VQKSSDIRYAPRLDATPEAEISALSDCYRFVIESHKKKRGRLLDKSGPDDGTKIKEDSANDHYTRI
jgi:hypothetical protein